jgi:hypothetical protein
MVCLQETIVQYVNVMFIGVNPMLVLYGIREAIQW